MDITTNERVSDINRCLNNPILLYESTSQNIPSNLRILLSTFVEDKLTEADHIVILAYTMMVETGFIPYHKRLDFKGMEISPTFDIKFLTAAQTLPNNWKNDNGIYKMDFVLPSLTDQKVCLTAKFRGDTALFTVWLKNIENTPSWCLAVECRQYILKRKTEFMMHNYFNVKELSQKFKNEIALPARSCLQLYGNVDVPELLNLSLEMKVLIFSYLNRYDIYRISETCRILYEVSRSKMLADKLGMPLKYKVLYKYLNITYPCSL